MEKKILALSIEEEISREIASYTGTRRIQIFKVFGNEIVCRGDFSRHENSPTGQVSAASFTYHFDNENRTVVKHNPIVLKSRQAVETYVRVVDMEEYILSGVTVCLLLHGNAVDGYVENYLPLLSDPRVHYSWYLTLDDEADEEAKKAALQVNRDLLVGTIWNLVAH